MRSFEYKDSIFTEPSLVAPNLAQGEKRGGAEAAYVSFPSRKFTIDANVKIGESNISQIVYWTHDDEFDTKPNSITNLPEPVMNNVLSFLYTVSDLFYFHLFNCYDNILLYIFLAGQRFP